MVGAISCRSSGPVAAVLNIRQMTIDDVPLGMRLKEKAGYEALASVRR
jgi:hypothetical protein